MENYSKARTRTMIKHPFYATALLSLDVVWSENVPGGNAATNGKALMFNPKTIPYMDVDVIVFIFVHEVLHVVLKHNLRRGHRNHALWNVACDYAINYMLKKAGFAVPDWVLYDERFKGMGAEQIYDVLFQEMQQQPQSGSGGDGDDGDDGDDEGEQSGGSSSGKSLSERVEERFGTGPLSGDVMDAPVRDSAEMAEMERSINQKLAQAATVAKAAGTLTADLAALVQEQLNPKVPWHSLLQHYMLAPARDDTDWKRRNRRFPDVYLPGKWSQKLGPIVFIPDTSMSIYADKDALQTICSEIAWCADQMNPESVTVLWCDTKVKNVQRFETGEFTFEALRPVGGGGTDMRVGLRAAEEYDPQVVVLLTDGETPWPDAEPLYPLITVCTTDLPVPIGQVVRT